ncbi:MAG: hypothetical protein NZ529_08600 [Cytophagaceae bacterium]|nr:hypothetical protein [Cytophagaceae bacterium]MDW8456842.1 hypothetical protein [Cytophagaceae bacterium]
MKIKENSRYAHIARWYMRCPDIAMVLGDTIHLSGVSKHAFLQDKKWLAHEMKHIEQFKKYGFVTFTFLYLLEWIKHGYHKNKFEVEARLAENNA